MHSHTFLWHDYETFGVHTRRDRPAQFAAIRTDAELNEIGAPLMLYCQPPCDYLPDPQSCLLTGITPQYCLQHGVPEHEFAAKIEQAFSVDGTVGVGYNTIRFDDEFTRFLFWRNLIDPYAREWQNQCGRWDLMDVVRMTYALRPEGIVWPVQEDGKPSFRLELLTAANGIAHAAAHDALSDVRATIALARLIRNRQPKLFDFCFALHKKDRVASEIGLPQQRPFLHVSGMFSTERGCLGVMWPLAVHPSNKNEVIAWDLSENPMQLRDLDASAIRLRLFTRSADLPAGTTRLPIKTIHLNKSPMVIGNLKTLSTEHAARWQIDLEVALQHAQHASELGDLSTLWQQVFARDIGLTTPSTPDVDEDLYGGFVGNSDRRLLIQLRSLSADKLAAAKPNFEDSRLEELLLRYRARNYPQSLNDDEQQRWEQYRRDRLFDGADGARSATNFYTEIDRLSEDTDERGEEILGTLVEYVEMIAPSPQ